MGRKVMSQVVQLKAATELEELDTPLGLETLRDTVPKGRRYLVTPSLVDTVNNIVDDPEVRDAFRKNILGYTDVLADPRITFTAYIQAVRYNSYKFMGSTNFDSYIKTFPERYQRMIDDGKSNDYISAIVSQYNGGKTVNLIWEQRMIPIHVMNYDVLQEAIMTQQKLMLDPKVSHKVRSDAANSLMMHLRQPEATKIKLDIGITEEASVKEFREQALSLVKEQRLALQAGLIDAKTVAESKIIPSTAVRLD
jgi:hypothetical protein